MRAINERRKLVEHEGHKHSVKRGFRWKLHFENIPWLVKVLDFVLKISFSRRWGEKNAADIELVNIEYGFENLPSAFDNTRILLITDLHIDGINHSNERIISIAGQTDYDYCIFGGDYCFGDGQEGRLAYSKIKELAEWLLAKSRVFGVLGNHDKYRMAEFLDECGVEMLMNEAACIEKDGERIYLAGVDDCHYYGADDIELAGEGILDGEFRMAVSHSPERYKRIAMAGYHLHLGGHTHGGQVCLPGGLAVVTSATIPRRIVKGKWRCGGMKGYTSRGVGTSGLGVRYFCRPEMTLITLKKA